MSKKNKKDQSLGAGAYKHTSGVVLSQKDFDRLTPTHKVGFEISTDEQTHGLDDEYEQDAVENSGEEIFAFLFGVVSLSDDVISGATTNESSGGSGDGGGAVGIV